jgi:hypothetical protein
MIRMLGTCLAVLLATVTLRAFAAEPKPDFSVKTKTIEISVTLDASIKADPALARNCRAEGKKWAAALGAVAVKTNGESQESFGSGVSTYDRTYSIRSVVNGRYVSVIRGEREYTGGAHPNHWEDTILWDRTTNKRISIRPFFSETADNGPTLNAMRQAVIASLKVEKKRRGAEGTNLDLIEGIEPKLLQIGPVSLAPSTWPGKSSGLTFHYAPYAVGSYAEGGYVAFVPLETLKPYLTREGVAIFGGSRPKADEDPQQ